MLTALSAIFICVCSCLIVVQDLFIPDYVPWEFIDIEDIKGKYPNSEYTESWTLENHMAIAEAVHLYYWDDSIAEWDILKIAFDTDCADDVNDFDRSHHFYAKREGFTNFDYSLNIGSDFDDVSIRAFEAPNQIVDFDILFFRKYEWDEIKISPSTAFAIAEQNGGSQIRNSLGDSCYIQMQLTTDGQNRGWVVRYGDDERYEIIVIDPATGKVKDKTFE